MSTLQVAVEKFLSKEAVPDHVMSASAPPLEKQYNALKTIVADNVKKMVNDPWKDVLIHLYSEIDDEWEWQEYVLERLAEEMEDKAPHLLVRGRFCKSMLKRAINYFPQCSSCTSN